MTSMIDAAISDIPPLFQGQFPAEYTNNVLGWGLTEHEIHQTTDDGIYQLITLDIDFGSKCSLGCPHCFQSNQQAYKINKGLSWDQTINMIDQAQTLGLKYVKILGAGEPFENTLFLDFLEVLSSRGIHTAIFTKGHVLGSDELCRQYFAERGIFTADQLIARLYELNTSILLGFNSFDEQIQNTSVGVGPRHQLHNYAELRDRALMLAVNQGFNRYIPGTPTRLSLVVAPFKPENIDAVPEIYRWGNRRNIYVAACPTTSSGNGHKELKREEKYDFDSYMEQVKNMYIEVYNWALGVGALKFDDFKRHGVSLYPGGHPCNQVAGGLYVKLDGRVFICPGNDTESFMVNANVFAAPLREIWMKSPNYRLAGDSRFNYECLARRSSFFEHYPNFYNDIFHCVINEYNKGNRESELLCAAV